MDLSLLWHVDESLYKVLQHAFGNFTFRFTKMGFNMRVPKTPSITGFFFFFPADGLIFTVKATDLSKKKKKKKSLFKKMGKKKMHDD